MIQYEKFTLDNGLEVIVHNDNTTPLAALNIIYKVGSKNEDPQKTGWAHLLEHLMFEGTKNNNEYDRLIELSGGTNNAFTNEDITNYYVVLPKNNIEIALMLEADRMQNLALDHQRVETQKKVVIEEFKQMVLDEPYEDAFMHLNKLAYKNHPYNWTTIGKCISHIEKANPEELRLFYENYYSPNNAILSIGGDFKTDEILKLIEKYFGSIPQRKINKKQIPCEPPQKKRRFAEVIKKVPHSRLYMAFHCGGRTTDDFYISDLLTDILDDGKSSRLFNNLVKTGIMTEVEAFTTGQLDDSLIIFIAQPSENISLSQAEEILWNEINLFIDSPIKPTEIQKTLNSLEYSNNLIKTNIFEKTYTLAYYQLLGSCDLFSTELDRYKKITIDDIKNFAKNTFQISKSNVLYYKSTQK